MKAMRTDFVWLLVIVAIGLNLRPLLTSISPLMGVIRDSTGLAFQSASLLTGLPVVAMGICAFGAGLLSRSIGEARGVAVGLIAIAIACAARALIQTGGALIASAVVAGVGVAVVQALLPGVMKARFTSRLPFAMGLYSASIMAGGGLGASVTPKIAAMVSWHAGLAFWAMPAVVALALWWWLARSFSVHRDDTRAVHSSLFFNRRAWTLGVHFGVVNGGYTCLVAWLPAYYQQLGWSVAESGALLAMMTVFQAASALLLPMAAARCRDRRPWLAAALAAQACGFAMLLFAPLEAPLVVVALLGAGLGGAFALTLVMTLDHADQPALAARLVAFVQGVGFVIAAVAPIVAGIARDASGGFTVSWGMLLAGVAAMIALTWVFAPHGYAKAMRTRMGARRARLAEGRG